MTDKDLAIAAIRRVHQNSSRNLLNVRDDLDDLHDLCEELLQAVESDMAMQEDER